MKNINKTTYYGATILVANIAIVDEAKSYNGWDFVSNKIGAQYEL